MSMQNFPKPLSEEETNYYINLLKNGDVNAQDILIERNLRLVVTIAKKYSSDEYTIDDFISAGIIGLIKAVRTYNPGKAKLATYAGRCIENEMCMLKRKKYYKKIFFSLDETIEDKDGSIAFKGELIADANTNVENEFEMREMYDLVNRCVNVLDDADIKLISMRYGLNGYQKQTQVVISDFFGISRSYVSRIEEHLLRDMRKMLDSNSLKKMEILKSIQDYFSHITFAQFLLHFREQYNSLNDSDQEIIRKFYNVIKCQEVESLSLDELEKQINMKNFPFLSTTPSIDDKKLIYAYNMHKGKFNEYRRDVINCYLLKELSEEEVIKRHPNIISHPSLIWPYLKVLLEKSYLDMVSGKEERKDTIKEPNHEYKEMEAIVSKDDFLVLEQPKLNLLIFNMYYGFNGYGKHGIPDIIKELHLNMTDIEVKNRLSYILLCIEKYKAGIRSDKWFTCEQLESFYLSNKDKLSEQERDRILLYLNEEQNKSIGDIQATDKYHILPTNIGYKLACYLYGKTIDFNNMSREKIIRILTNKKGNIDNTHKLQIMRCLNIGSRELMSINEKKRLVRLLYKMYIKRMKAKEQNDNNTILPKEKQMSLAQKSLYN